MWNVPLEFQNFPFIFRTAVNYLNLEQKFDAHDFIFLWSNKNWRNRKIK